MLLSHLLGVAAIRPAFALFGALAAVRLPVATVLGVAMRPALAVLTLAAMAVRPARALFGFMGDVTLNPNSNGMPGAGFAQTLLDWMGQVALWGSLAAILVGACIYGLSQHIGNTYGASKGRLLALAGAVGAGLTGIAPTAINLLHTAAGK